MGIIITSDLKPSEQSKRAAGRATMVTSKIKNKLSFFSHQLANLLYKSFVSPHLEFAVSAWNAHRRGDVEILENVQRKFSKLVHELKSRFYVEWREALFWSTLENRRRRGDLIQLNKIQHGQDRVEFILSKQLLTSNGFDSPASFTRRDNLANERQLVGNCGIRHNYSTNRTNLIQ